MKGLYITVEGIDGSGKTTHIELLEQYLRGQGYDVLITQEPGGTRIGEKIRQILKDPSNLDLLPTTELLLFMAARVQFHQQIIKPAIREGKVIISSRGLDSTYAYQGYGEGLSLDYIRRVESIVMDKYPDLTIILDLPVQVAMKRIDRALDRIEGMGEEFYERVREGYLTIARIDPRRCKVVNANMIISGVHKQIKNIVDRFLEEREFTINKTSVV